MGRHEPAALSSWPSHLPGPRRTQQEPWSDGVPTLLGAQGMQVSSGELGAGHAVARMGGTWSAGRRAQRPPAGPTQAVLRILHGSEKAHGQTALQGRGHMDSHF